MVELLTGLPLATQLLVCGLELSGHSPLSRKPLGSSIGRGVDFPGFVLAL